MNNLKEMKWLSTELPKETAGKFKEYLRDMHIKYESSECFDLIHFEVLVTQRQAELADAFIDKFCVNN